MFIQLEFIIILFLYQQSCHGCDELKFEMERNFRNSLRTSMHMNIPYAASSISNLNFATKNNIGMTGTQIQYLFIKLKIWQKRGELLHNIFAIGMHASTVSILTNSLANKRT
jgi:hypothetical protein